MTSPPPQGTPGPGRQGSLRRKASFYQSNLGARASQKFEDSFNASFLVGNSSLQQGLDRSQEGGERRKSALLFPHLLKRKRSEEHEASPVKRIRRRLNSFSDPADATVKLDRKQEQCVPVLGGAGDFFPQASSTMKPASSLTSSLDFVPPSSSTLLPGALPALQRTPRKEQQGQHGTPRKEDQDMFSPSRRVQWNMAPQPPTPHRGTPAKSILKTPSKTPSKTPIRQTPVRTPSRQTDPLFRTPVKTPIRTPRRDLGTPSKMSIQLSTPSKDLQGPSSPIILSSRKKARMSTTPPKVLHTTTPSRAPSTLQATPGLLHGFSTPSPSLARKSSFIQATTKEILASTDLSLPSTLTSKASLSSLPSLLVPSLLPHSIFNSSALTPRPLDRSALATSGGDGDYSLLLPEGQEAGSARSSSPPPGLTRTPVKLDPSQELELVSPRKRLVLDLGGEEQEQDDVEEDLGVKPFLENNEEELEQEEHQEAEQMQQPITNFARFSSGYSSGPATSPCQYSSPVVPESGLAYDLATTTAGLSYDHSTSATGLVYDPTHDLSSFIEESQLPTPPVNPILRNVCRSSSGSRRMGGRSLSRSSSSRSNRSEEHEEQPKIFLPKLMVPSPFFAPEDDVKVEAEEEDDVKKHTVEDAEVKTKKSKSKKALLLKSPARFKCEYCQEKFSNRGILRKHMKEELDMKLQEIAKSKLAKKEARKERQDVPKELAGLQDKLSPFFSTQGQRSRKRPNLFSEGAAEDAESEEQEDGGGRRSKRPVSYAEEDEEEVLEYLKDVKKAYVDDVEEEEYMEVDQANEVQEDEISHLPRAVSELQDKLSPYFNAGGKRTRKVPERLATTLANTPKGSRKEQVRRSLVKEEGRRLDRRLARLQTAGEEQVPGATSTPLEEGRSVRRRPRVSYAEVPDTPAFDLSTGDEESPRTPSRKRFVLESSLRSPGGGSLLNASRQGVKVSSGALERSQEMFDVSVALERSFQEQEEEQVTSPVSFTSPLPPKSPGKYISLLTPGRGLQMKIRRVRKPGEQQKLDAPSSSKSSSPWIPRLSRAACQEMGISPNKLQNLMAASPPAKPNFKQR